MSRDRVRVLLALAPPDGTTRYVDQVVTELPESIRIRYFGWMKALFTPYDALHLHWPEFLVRGRFAPLRTVALALLVVRLRITRTPVVRTVHNEHPHEPASRTERVLLAALDHCVTHHIRLNNRTKTPLEHHRTTIPHGHYADRFRTAEPVDRVPGRVLMVGLLRPYKGIDTVIDSLADSEKVSELRIVGKPLNDAYERELRALTENTPRVSTLFGFVDDDVLVEEVRAADVVVLPYRSIHNSGILFVALSLGTPVLARYSDTVDDVRREVGADWVRTFEGDVTGADLDSSVASAHLVHGCTPTFDGRDWTSVAESHARVYRSVLR